MTGSSFFSPDISSRPSFEGSTLILPVVSLGNVPQLAVDLLLQSSLGFERIGHLSPEYHITVVGARDRRPGADRVSGISFPAEIYQTKDHNQTVVQYRSPVIKALQAGYLGALSKWIAASHFQSVLLLVSIDAATRNDEALRADTPFFQTCLPAKKQALASLVSRVQSRYPPLVRSTVPGHDQASSNVIVPILPAGGFARRLLVELSQLQGFDTEVAAVTMYVAEGDNRGDATSLAEQICRLLVDGEVKLQEPVSWQAASVIGLDVQSELFG